LVNVLAWFAAVNSRLFIFSSAKGDSMNISDYVDIVRESRQKIAGVFPLPDVSACIDYAITEAAEAIDARLRAQRNGDKRNNGKQLDERAEWGQCGYMIASAIIQIDTSHVYMHTCFDCADGNIYAVIRSLCTAQDKRFVIDTVQHIDAMDKWQAYAQRKGWDAAELLRETCAAFEAKHLASKKPFAYPVLSAEEAQRQGEAQP